MAAAGDRLPTRDPVDGDRPGQVESLERHGSEALRPPRARGYDRNPKTSLGQRNQVVIGGDLMGAGRGDTLSAQIAREFFGHFGFGLNQKRLIRELAGLDQVLRCQPMTALDDQLERFGEQGPAIETLPDRAERCRQRQLDLTFLQKLEDLGIRASASLQLHVEQPGISSASGVASRARSSVREIAMASELPWPELIDRASDLAERALS